MSVIELVNWLLYGGGMGLVVSNGLERWPWFLAQTPEVKWWLSKVLVAVAGLTVYALITNVSPDVLLQIETYYKIVFGVLVLNGGIEVYHQSVK